MTRGTEREPRRKPARPARVPTAGAAGRRSASAASEAALAERLLAELDRRVAKALKILAGGSRSPASRAQSAVG